MEKVIKFVTYKEAEHNDLIYISRLGAEDRLKECFDLRRLNYFGTAEGNLPRLKKVFRFINRNDYEKENA